MVDVLVNGISSFEIIIFRLIFSIRETVLCPFRIPLAVPNDFPIGIQNHRSRLSVCQKLFLFGHTHIRKSLVMILIYSFVTETVNCPERIVQLHTLQHVTVFLCKLGIQHVQYGGIHFENFVLIVTECYIEIGRKLTGFDNPVCRYIEFPTQISHFTNIPISQFGESRTRRYGDIPHQHVVRS